MSGMRLFGTLLAAVLLPAAVLTSIGLLPSCTGEPSGEREGDQRIAE